MLDLQKLSAQYQQALLRQVVPFWLKHSRDGLCGGYFDYLSTTGEVIEGDKSILQQAQQVLTFAWLYNTVEAQTAWLDHARHGGIFLSQFAHQDDLTCYAQLDRRGRPVTLATNSLPDLFCIAAYAQLHHATASDEWAMLAKEAFSSLWQRRHQLRTEQARSVSGIRQLRHLSEASALLRVASDLKPLLDEATHKEIVEATLQEILYEFLDRRTQILRESVLPEGAFINTPEGRRLNVGLTFQTSAHLLSVCAESNDRKLALQVVTWVLRLCELAWDDMAGGLNQYADLKNQPLIFADWRQKWAWVQLEAIQALVQGYSQTRHPDCLRWLKRIHDYTFAHFPDPEFGGWRLVFDQQKQQPLSAKSTEAVGCYSLVGPLIEITRTLASANPLQPATRIARAV